MRGVVAGALLVALASIGLNLGAEPDRTGKPHWAFQKPGRAAVPKVRNAVWVRNPVDAFVLARLEQAGLEVVPPADRATLLRRISFDLTGLPPTPQELNDFLADTRPDACERVVDRLLASPHYGERWAQHWLDVVRYAELNGYELDAERPHARRYRDWVVQAFNSDKPFDQFLTEQIAGDLLASGKEGAEKQALWIAAGFHRCGQVHQVGGNIDAEMSRQEVLTEMVSGVGNAFLGLTVHCARCHDHKFDPLTQKEFYGLEAFFAATHPKEISFASPADKEEHDRRKQELEAKLAPPRKQVKDIDAPYQARLTEAKKTKLEPAYREALATEPSKRTPEQQKLAANAGVLVKVTWDEIIAALTPEHRERRAKLREQIHDLEARMPVPVPHAWTVSEGLLTPATHLLKRGNVKHKGEKVATHIPAMLGLPLVPREGRQTLDRLDLARWLTHPDHPLTARVFVNRLWQHHFGRALVTTPNDFGKHGEQPSHPELLDWLATEFQERGWSIKAMHRLLVLSNTYQQSSRSNNPKAAEVDAGNRLLWRANRRRLQGEGLRDSILAVSGTLNSKLGGPMVRVPLEPEVYDLIFTEGEPDGLWHATPDVREYTRRSLYLFSKRTVRLPLLEAFDQPDTLSSCPVRATSTFAPQALILLNGPFMQEQGQAFAARLLREAGSERDRVIEHAYRLALGRSVRATEKELAREFLAGQTELLRDRLRVRQRVNLPSELPEGIDPAFAAALVDYCVVLLNANEFVYVW